jgi:hypothetical protein
MRRLIALGTCVLLAACARIPTSDVDPFIGLYNLVSVDGAPLPVLGSPPGADPRLEVLRVDVTLNADHSASRVEFVRISPIGRTSMVTRDERSGTFALKGEVITISFPDSTRYTGTVGGGVLVLDRGPDDTRRVQLFWRDRTFE